MIRIRGLTTGEMIPNEDTLAEKFNVSIGTVKRAMSLLVNEKVLTRKQGKGTFIRTLGKEISLIPEFLGKSAEFEGSIWKKLNIIGVENLSESSFKKCFPKDLMFFESTPCFQICFGMPENPPVTCLLNFHQSKAEWRKNNINSNWQNHYQHLLSSVSASDEEMSINLSDTVSKKMLGFTKHQPVIIVSKSYVSANRSPLAHAVFFADPIHFKFTTSLSK